MGGGDDKTDPAETGRFADTDGMGVAEEEDVDFSGAQVPPSCASVAAI